MERNLRKSEQGKVRSRIGGRCGSRCAVALYNNVCGESSGIRSTSSSSPHARSGSFDARAESYEGISKSGRKMLWLVQAWGIGMWRAKHED